MGTAQLVQKSGCFKAESVVRNVTVDGDRLYLAAQNGWQWSPDDQIAFRPQKGQRITFYYGEEGDYAESTICGVDIDGAEVYFDGTGKLHEAFRDALRNKDHGYFNSFITGSLVKYPEVDFASRDDVVWFVTIEGMLYYAHNGANHLRLLTSLPSVKRSSIVAAGKKRSSNSHYIWKSDLLKIDTPELLKPAIEADLSMV